MADTALTKEQGLALLTKLATDDAFRAHYEHKPAHALFDLGVPADVIARLPGRCLCQRKLGSKQAMQEARTRLAADTDTSLLIFVVPDAKL
jgi:putative modified peptide